MSDLTKSLRIEYLAINRTSKIDDAIQQKFARLNAICNYILKCQVKVANIAYHGRLKSKFSYLISVNLTMQEGFDVYTLRSPQSKENDSIDRAISDVFAMVYRKLIELKLENRLNYQ